MRRLMPFTALKLNLQLFAGDGHKASKCCAPPNAVYGIETSLLFSIAASSIARCAPPNAVYGIETGCLLIGNSNSIAIKVVRRLMPFTALKPPAEI